MLSSWGESIADGVSNAVGLAGSGEVHPGVDVNHELLSQRLLLLQDTVEAMELKAAQNELVAAAPRSRRLLLRHGSVIERAEQQRFRTVTDLETDQRGLPSYYDKANFFR